MCYAGGPRCSSHVRDELQGTQNKLAQLRAENASQEKVMEYYEKVQLLEREFSSTPQGQKHLENQINNYLKAGHMDKADEYEIKLYYAKQLRTHDMQERKKRLQANPQEITNHKLSTASHNRDEDTPESIAERAQIMAENRRILNESRLGQNNSAFATRSSEGLVTPNEIHEQYSSYDSALIPQANDITKISSIVETINNGATTSASIGESLRMADRQGHYYANAGVYLGLIEKQESLYDGAHDYTLTENGRKVLESSDHERAEHIRKMVNATPLMQVYHNSGRDPKAVVEKMKESENSLDSNTLQRRLATVVAWDKTVNNKKFVEELKSVHKDTGEQSIIAGQKLKAVRAEKKLKEKKLDEARGGFCEIHGTMRSPMGVCFDCQDEM